MIFSLKSKIRGRGCWSLRLRCLWVPSCRAFSRARRTRCERGRARAVRRCRPHTNSGYDKLTRPARLRWQGYSCPRLLTPQTTFSSLEASATLRVESSLDTQGTDRALSCPSPPSLKSLLSHIRDPHAPRCTHAQQSVGVRGHQRATGSTIKGATAPATRAPHV